MVNESEKLREILVEINEKLKSLFPLPAKQLSAYQNLDVHEKKAMLKMIEKLLKDKLIEAKVLKNTEGIEEIAILRLTPLGCKSLTEA